RIRHPFNLLPYTRNHHNSPTTAATLKPPGKPARGNPLLPDDQKLIKTRPNLAADRRQTARSGIINLLLTK
ncbi:hypothetical protein, partial [Marinobacter sp.]|uniref:hypothetical protein n=1 Tax=Marinobacter sp. TaxID=50741 RepID=UPI0035C73D78